MSRLDDMLVGLEPPKEEKRVWAPQKLSEAEEGALKGNGKDPADYVAIPCTTLAMEIQTVPINPQIDTRGMAHLVIVQGTLPLGLLPDLAEPGVLDPTGQVGASKAQELLAGVPQIRLIVKRSAVDPEALAAIDEVLAAHGKTLDEADLLEEMKAQLRGPAPLPKG